MASGQAGNAPLLPPSPHSSLQCPCYFPSQCPLPPFPADLGAGQHQLQVPERQRPPVPEHGGTDCHLALVHADGQAQQLHLEARHRGGNAEQQPPVRGEVPQLARPGERKEGGVSELNKTEEVPQLTRPDGGRGGGGVPELARPDGRGGRRSVILPPFLHLPH